MDKKTTIQIAILAGVGTFWFPVHFLEYFFVKFSVLFTTNTTLKFYIGVAIIIATIIILANSTLQKLKDNKIFIDAYKKTLIVSGIVYLLYILGIARLMF